jgi:hypothetical protein
VFTVEKKFIEPHVTIESQKAKDSFVRLVAIVHGKIRMYVVALMLQIGLREKMPIDSY